MVHPGIPRRNLVRGAAGTESHCAVVQHAMNIDRYTCRVPWSPEDAEHVGLCSGIPSLTGLAESPEGAGADIRQLVKSIAGNLEADGEAMTQFGLN